MTTEDLLAEKLKGNNCLIKFIDGEELFIRVEAIARSEESSAEWFSETEIFLNGTPPESIFSEPDIALSRNLIKYIIKI